MKITTIQIHEEVKSELDKMKMGKETYEKVIQRLVKEAEKRRKEHEALMIEGYKEMAEESLKIMEEFKYADAEMDWEWDESKKK